MWSVYRSSEPIENKAFVSSVQQSVSPVNKHMRRPMLLYSFYLSSKSHFFPSINQNRGSLQTGNEGEQYVLTLSTAPQLAFWLSPRPPASFFLPRAAWVSIAGWHNTNDRACNTHTHTHTHTHRNEFSLGMSVETESVTQYIYKTLRALAAMRRLSFNYVRPVRLSTAQRSAMTIVYSKAFISPALGELVYFPHSCRTPSTLAKLR